MPKKTKTRRTTRRAAFNKNIDKLFGWLVEAEQILADLGVPEEELLMDAATAVKATRQLRAKIFPTDDSERQWRIVTTNVVKHIAAKVNPDLAAEADLMKIMDDCFGAIEDSAVRGAYLLGLGRGMERGLTLARPGGAMHEALSKHPVRRNAIGGAR